MSPDRRYEFTPAAERDFRRLDTTTRRRITDALDRLVEDEPHGDVRKLRSSDDEWRLRVGDWRIRFLRDKQARLVVVLGIDPRGRAYRD
ncbi:MAG: type II toxin-antitoxin system RelE family toxin [Thermomicrobiales bacterium]